MKNLIYVLDVDICEHWIRPEQIVSISMKYHNIRALFGKRFQFTFTVNLMDGQIIHVDEKTYNRVKGELNGEYL